MNNPLISIIVPCYNQAQYLPETLDSVLAQTYPYWECVIVNDGSPDNTEEIAKQYCLKDERFKYVFKENGGLSSARNAGLKIINGEFVQFLDSDDLIDACKFEKQLIDFKSDDNLDVSISNYCCFNNLEIIYPTDEWNNLISTDIKHDILFRWDKKFSIPIHTAVFKRNCLDIILFNEQLTAKEDWVFWVDLIINNQNFKYINLPLALYRVNLKSMTQNRNLMYNNTIKAFFIIYDKLNNSDKNLFIKRIQEDLLFIYNDNATLINDLSKIQISKAYRLGKSLIKPFSLLKKMINL